jgi:hypothetical protein
MLLATYTLTFPEFALPPGQVGFADQHQLSKLLLVITVEGFHQFGDEGLLLANDPFNDRVLLGTYK